MQVILDTTEFYSDLEMRHPAFQFLETYLIRHPAQLIVPRIVCQEVVNHFREALTKTFQKAESALQSLRRLAPETIQGPTLNLDRAATVERFNQQFSGRLQRLRAIVPSYDDTPIASLVERALMRRKPFDSEGRAGFRDALIWEAVLNIARTTEGEIVFVTSNSGDFGNHRQLAPDLVNDLVTAEVDPNRIVLCGGLQRFVEEIIQPSLERMNTEDASASFERFNPRQFFIDEHEDISHELSEIIRYSDFVGLTEELLSKFEDPELGELETAPTTFEVGEAWDIEGDQIAARIDFTVDGTIRCLEQTETIWGDDDTEDHEGGVEFVLHMTVILNRTSREVTNWEINDVDMYLTNNWPFPDF
jgi:hypothetical protein